MRIGVLGGTFDPVHRGHIHLAREAKEKLRLDKILFVPAYLAPNKKAKKNEISPAHFRLKMLKLAIAGIPKLKISYFELKKKRVVYTVETLKALCKRYPRDQFYLLTGADNILGLHHWKSFDTILRLCHFVVAKRPEFRSLAAEERKKFIWLAMRPLKISSTDIRKKIREGKSVSRLLPDRVAGFIKQNRLYQQGKGA